MNIKLIQARPADAGEGGSEVFLRFQSAVGGTPSPPYHFLGLPWNVVDNKGPKMRKMRQDGTTLECLGKQAS